MVENQKSLAASSLARGLIQKGSSMHKCQFCEANYLPRKQVKSPRACHKKRCQHRRQKANEYEWRVKHNLISDPEYHRLQRKQRTKTLTALVNLIFECASVGSKFLNRSMQQLNLRSLLSDFIFTQGIRRIKKLWAFQIPSNYEDLNSALELKLLQTS